MPHHEPQTKRSLTLEEELLEALTPDGRDDIAAIERGLPLAELECRHGRLPIDRTVTCGCWR